MDSSSIVVAFDEAGNTGQNLLDPAQPVFVLASVRLDHGDAAELARRAAMPGARELHFARMRKTGTGQKLLLALLRSDLITPDAVKPVRYHKSFMVTTKIVDMLVETLAHEMGFDLYERGANLGMANLYHTVMPVFCGADAMQLLQERFVGMVREKTPAAVACFYDVVESMYENTTHDPFRADLRVLLATRAIVGEVLEGADITALDPAIPAFFELATKWTAALGTEFVILHDPSKPMVQQRELLQLLMSTDQPTQIIGYDRRTTAFPIRAAKLHLEVASHELPLIQIADVIAGSIAYVLTKRAMGTPDAFADALLDTKLADIDIGGIWPSTKVTPDELGTNAVGGINPIDHLTDFVAQQRRHRRAGE